MISLLFPPPRPSQRGHFAPISPGPNHFTITLLFPPAGPVRTFLSNRLLGDFQKDDASKAGEGPSPRGYFLLGKLFLRFWKSQTLSRKGALSCDWGQASYFALISPDSFQLTFAITLLFPPTFGVWETRQKAIVSLISFVFSMREGHLSIPSDYLFHEFR